MPKPLRQPRHPSDAVVAFFAHIDRKNTTRCRRAGVRLNRRGYLRVPQGGAFGSSRAVIRPMSNDWKYMGRGARERAALAVLCAPVVAEPAAS
jgi:hypothetical protein